MPLSDPATALLRCSDVVTIGDIATLLFDLLDGRHCPRPFRFVVDLGRVSDIDLTFREMHRLLPLLHRVSAASKASFSIAMVTPDETTRAAAGVFRLLTGHDRNIEASLHLTLADALRHLDQTPVNLPSPVPPHAR